MPLNYATLKTEIQNDTQVLGYSAFRTSRNDAALADIINFRRNGSAQCPVNSVAGSAITIRRSDISTQSIIEAIDINDFTALPGTPSAAQLSTERRLLAWLTALTSSPMVRLQNDDGTDNPVISNFQLMFAGGTATRTRLLALAVRSGSRAEALFGVGNSVSVVDVGTALNN